MENCKHENSYVVSGMFGGKWCPKCNMKIIEQQLYDIEDKNGHIMPRHWSDRARTYDEAKKILDRLNNNGENKPYKMIEL